MPSSAAWSGDTAPYGSSCPTWHPSRKRGIPSVFIMFEDQDECWKQACRINGIPNMRRVHGSRHVPGPEDVDSWIDKLVNELVRPLTEEEKNPAAVGSLESPLHLRRYSRRSPGILTSRQRTFPSCTTMPLSANIPTAFRSCSPPKNGWRECSRAPATSRMR